MGELENRNDDAAIEQFNTIYQRWHEGDLDLRLPGGETGPQVLDRYLAGGDPAAVALPRRPRVDG